MNLDIAKNKIKEKLGIHMKFVYKGARNQIEEFEGKIVRCYPHIFIIETDDCIIKSFTYNDFIIRNIKLIL
ncbi:MAG: hypothetical protein IK137_04465 [Bacilli bacterium]|nr:hypothetical protein [Bacilli bacterium]